jgi:hypothetical protein
MLSIPRIATSDGEKHSNFDVQVDGGEKKNLKEQCHSKAKKKKVGVIYMSTVLAVIYSS